MAALWSKRCVLLRILAFGLLGFISLSGSISAHHATAAEYDVSKTVVLKGTITKIDWANPHIHVYIDVKENQHDENWSVEFPSPGGVIVAGLSKDSLTPGTVLTFEGYPSKASTGKTLPQLAACAKAITLPDGSHVTFVVGI